MHQYYGINSDGDTVYVAMSKQGVIDYAEKHPDEDIIKDKKIKKKRKKKKKIK